MAFASPTVHTGAVTPPDVSLIRLYFLRAGYALLAVGLALTVWPSIFAHAPWTLWQGVGKSMLSAIGLLAFLGLRYPLKMLPLLFFEMAWKSIWLLAVPLPLWLNHAPIDANTADTVQACVWAIVFPIVIPWHYVVTTFVLQPGDRWR